MVIMVISEVGKVCLKIFYDDNENGETVFNYFNCLIKMKILFRKANSLLIALFAKWRMLWIRIKFRACGINIIIGKDVSIGRMVQIQVTDGGSISIGSRCSLSEGVKIVAQGGMVTIADDVFIGVGCMIVCKEHVEIGKDTQIAEYVVIRDQDHRTDSRPIRMSGFHTSPINIGNDVWIGCKSSILRGSIIGDRSVIGAHALVRSHIDKDMLAVGVPARAIKSMEVNL